MSRLATGDEEWDDSDFEFYHSYELTFWDEIEAMANGFYLKDPLDEEEE